MPPGPQPRFALGLTLTLVGGGLCVAGIFLGVAPLIAVYRDAMTDPLKESGVSAQQTSSAMLRGLIVGAIGVPIFLAGSIMTGRSFIQRLRRAASGR